MVACGSDDPELSVEEYRQRANEICVKLTDKAEGLDPPRSVDGIADYLERLLELARPYDRRFRDLDPPDELARLHDRGVELNRKLDRAFEDIAGRLRASADPATTFRRELEGLLPQIRRADDLFQRLGLDECLAGPQLGPSPGPT